MPGSVAISGLGALAAADLAIGDLLAIVDISDTTQAPTGTTKKITAGSILNGGVLPASFTLVKVGDGTVGAPSVTFASDLDCGLYRIGANNIGVAVNGAKVLDVSTAGLGITGALSGATTGAFSGIVTMGTNSQVTGSGRLILGASTSGAQLNMLAFGATFKNWQITPDFGAGLSFVPSTAAGGSTFTTSVFAIAESGALTTGTINGQTISSSASLTGTLAVAGNFTNGANIALHPASATELQLTNSVGSLIGYINYARFTADVEGAKISTANNAAVVERLRVVPGGQVLIGTTTVGATGVGGIRVAGASIFDSTLGAGVITATASPTPFVSNSLDVSANLRGAFRADINGTTKYFIGYDTSGNGAILNAGADAANLIWTDAGTFTFRGRALVDDTTDATSTTNGSLQTDGGASVVKNLCVGGQTFGPVYDVGSVGAGGATIDWDNGNMQELILTADCNLAFSNGRDGSELHLFVKGDGTAGPYTAGVPANVLAAGGGGTGIQTSASLRQYVRYIYVASSNKYYLTGFQANYTT